MELVRKSVITFGCLDSQYCMERRRTEEFARMNDEVLQQLVSNSNSAPDFSLSDKLAKLESRMAGKSTPVTVPAPWITAPKTVTLINCSGRATTVITSSSDSDNDVRHCQRLYYW